MEIFFLLPVISLQILSCHLSTQISSSYQKDTTAIIHLLDGNIVEWPAEKFTTDNATKIRYAIDNDSQMLFLAISIPDKKSQQRIVQQGMRLFIDVKGKKKENRGVEFPLGMENGSSISDMKIFGFTSPDALPQSIKTEGTINIALTWDSSFILNIEYRVPLKMLEGSMAELNNKKISVGWKINEADAMNSNTTQPVAVTSELVGVPAGSRPPANRNVGSTQKDPFPQSNTSKAQPIWATHTIIF